MPPIPSPALGAKIIVEAGNIYSNEAPSLEHEIGAKLGSLVCIVLNSMGHYTQNWLFIDNYNPQFEQKPWVLDKGTYTGTGAYITLLEQWGFKPDVVIKEGDLVYAAKDLLAFLLAHDYAGKDEKTGSVMSLFYSSPNTRIHTSVTPKNVYAGDTTTIENGKADLKRTISHILGLFMFAGKLPM